jgi:hypothetical protein
MVDKIMAWFFSTSLYLSFRHQKAASRHFDCRFQGANIQRLSMANTPIIFRFPTMIKVIASTWSTRCRLGFFPSVIIHHFATKKPYRVILTADSKALTFKDYPWQTPQSYFASQP